MGIPQSTMFGSVTSSLPQLLPASCGGTNEDMGAVYLDLLKLEDDLLGDAIWI